MEGYASMSPMGEASPHYGKRRMSRPTSKGTAPVVAAHGKIDVRAPTPVVHAAQAVSRNKTPMVAPIADRLTPGDHADAQHHRRRRRHHQA